LFFPEFFAAALVALEEKLSFGTIPPLFLAVFLQHLLMSFFPYLSPPLFLYLIVLLQIFYFFLSERKETNLFFFVNPLNIKL